MDYDKLIGKVPDHVYAQLKEFGSSFGLTSPLRLTHFLATMAHESMGFKKYEENLNYSAQALANTWPTRYSVNPKAAEKVPNKLALQIQRRPELIAAYSYGGRMGNNTFTGLNGARESDGWKHRGFGAGQLTGKTLQQNFFKSIGLDPNSNPELIRDKYPITSAMWNWHVNGFNLIADKGTGESVIRELRKKYNGGLIGIDDVIKQFKKYRAIFDI